MTIVIAGGSGFLGRKLVKRLENDGHSVTILTRKPARTRDVQWNPDGSPGKLPQHLDGQEAVINLAGEGIADGRWTSSRKAALRNSRILATQTLVRAVAQCAQPPKVFISASAVGYYGPCGNEPITETAAAGSDFLSRLCVEWEQEAWRVGSPKTRLAIVRTGLALAGDGGALPRMLLPFKLGLGATIGTGDQFMPWIHVADWTALVSWLVQNDRATGAFNAAAPTPVKNRTFTRTLARVLHRPAVLHAPAFVLRAALGEMSTILVNGQRVLPACAEQLGFRFTHRELEPALRSVLGV
ncbi:MAG: TIGR01777 family oxidoreductase [Vicinamibacterales bacterium]